MDLEEALAQADVYAEETEVCTIDNDLRTITIPSGLQTVGVESDEDVRRLNFQMPKQYGEVDLSEFNIRINFLNANNSGDVYAVTDKAISGDNITFSWLVGRNALAYRGSIRFIVCLKKTDAEGVVQQEFNTTVATLSVLEGLETTEQVIQQNPDIIEQILTRLDELEEGGGGGGLTTAQVNALDGMFKKCAFTGNVSAEYTAFKQAFGIESGGGEEEPTDKTLTSISATYTGGEVTVGTALIDLTGITVTAHYSDGSTDTITGYTLSGEIVEGKNTITVSYGGKTTTFTVTGVAEESYAELSNSADLWEVGGIQPIGTGTTSANRLRTVATLPYEVKKISVDDGYSYILVVYSEAQTEMPTDTSTVLLTGKGYYNPNGISGNVSADSFLVSSGTYFNGELLISEVRANINSIYGNTAGDRAHFRILLKNNDDTTLTADDGLHVHLWGVAKNYVL